MNSEGWSEFVAQWSVVESMDEFVTEIHGYTASRMPSFSRPSPFSVPGWFGEELKSRVLG